MSSQFTDPARFVQVQELANRLRLEIIEMVATAGSGHLAGPLGCAEALAFLYSFVLRFDPKQPLAPQRDRFFLSAGHLCPLLYAVLAEFDYFPLSELNTFRQFGSRLQGHPMRQPEIGLENTSGPLGQGVSMAVGQALALQKQFAAIDHLPRVYVLSSDGEQQEGQVWEAYQAAAHYNLSNLTVLIDVNNIQISGSTTQVMNLGDLAAKLTAFGWDVQEINGHELSQLDIAFTHALQVSDRPQAILLDTIPGRGVSFMENDYRWHSQTLTPPQTQQAITELKTQLQFDFEPGLWTFPSIESSVDDQPIMKSTREGFGEKLTELAADHPELIVLDADLKDSLQLTDFAAKYPDQFVEVGVAEQNLAGMAAGFAMTGRTAITASFAAFNPGRNWEQIRIAVAEQNLPVIIIGSHAGLATGPDGATHQALEDIALMRVLPKMKVIVPADYEETKKALQALIENPTGPAYLRLAREKQPLLTQPHDRFVIGEINQLQAGQDLTVIACGMMVEPACQAAAQVTAETKSSIRVLNCHTIKPLDEKTIWQAAAQTKRIITIEDHQIAGGLGGAVAECLTSQGCSVPLRRLGVDDNFGETGTAAQLWDREDLSVEDIKREILAWLDE